MSYPFLQISAKLINSPVVERTDLQDCLYMTTFLATSFKVTCLKLVLLQKDDEMINLY